jgi:hypothetical protein
MSKRSNNFEHNSRGLYPTPASAVPPPSIHQTDPMTTAICEHGLTLRYISLRARKVPKVKRPALIWLKDTVKDGRGPETFHQEFLSALFGAAGAVLIFPSGISSDQEQSAIDAAVSTGFAVVVITTPRCAKAWKQAKKLASLRSKSSVES